MTKLRFILGFSIPLALFITGMIVSGNIVPLYVDPLSFVFSVIIPYIIITLIYTPTEQVKMTGMILNSQGEDLKVLKGAVNYLNSLKRMIIACTVATFLLGMIGLLAHLDTPENLGRNLAVALICVFYSALYILIVIEPLRGAAEKKLNEI
jgi:hypothetical protein